MHIALVWQRYLPYHHARVRRLAERLAEVGGRLTAVEVASQDAAYGFPADDGAHVGYEFVTCFHDATYHHLNAGEIRHRVLDHLESMMPDVVFAPATPFPEGMAAISWRIRSRGRRCVIMDDAWERSDHRGSLTRWIKRRIHRLVDAAFVPASSHVPYFISLGFPPERIVTGVDVVDNDAFAAWADAARSDATSVRARLELPPRYFLFVGRLLPRKGLDTLLAAHTQYREQAGGDAWPLVLVGEGPEKKELAKVPAVYLKGARFGEELGSIYGLAEALIAPSHTDPWALVVNEACAAGIPVLVSSGCGCANSLVHATKNGWVFPQGDIQSLVSCMSRISSMDLKTRLQMGEFSREVVAEYSLDRFCEGVFEAIKLPRRVGSNPLARLFAFLWRGRVATN